jgi:transposase
MESWVVETQQTQGGDPVEERIPWISRPERRRLLREGRKSDSTETFERFRIVAMLSGGRSVNAVARLLDVAIAHVSRTQSRFLRGGKSALYDQRRTNGDRKVTPEFLEALTTTLISSPPDFGWMRPTWTRELLCIVMQERGFARIAVCTMGRALHQIGARLGSPKPFVLCPWSRERKERVLKQIRRLEANASKEEPVLYADEVDVHLNPKIGHDWMLPGLQRGVRTPGQNKKFYLAGALDVRTGRLHATGHGSKSSRLFVQLLFHLVSRYRRARRIHLILDNYVIHSSQVTARALASLGGRVVLHFLPPYCPDHNRIERVWLDFHANVTRNHRCRTLDELLDHARRFLLAYRWRRAQTQETKYLRMAA